ncbi:OsmC family protein [Parahaliea aestuarii]|uniref:OsmC family protein n=1 Tax=Parahaliea aestuarii TaxID=1852021 RepID=A0A5C9A1S7_9GAMM|nr:OsmC family protein [Parahaliea aestuarii]TXS93587.1 OsmC family protein [Parahaliea aestuarii]
MDEFPHTYSVAVSADPDDAVRITAEGLPGLAAAPPRQFGGSGEQWSPEDLLMASLASCFVLSFRAIAGMNNLEWSELKVEASGELDKVERITKFTRVTIDARLAVGAEEDSAKAERLLQKAEAACFISNSLNCEVHLQSEIFGA